MILSMVVGCGQRIINRLPAKGKAQVFLIGRNRLLLLFMLYLDQGFYRDRGNMGKRIWIIDDDHVIQESCMSCSATRATSSPWRRRRSGFDLIVRKKPDVSSPISCCRGCTDRPVRENPRHREFKHIPIVLIPVYKDVNLRMYVFKGLANDFIEKPFQERTCWQGRAPGRRRS